jgi:hypothetical protein
MTARILYLAHPTLRALVVRLHSQLNAFVHFVVSLETPIPHANANPLTLGDSRDPRATILAKANVMDVLGKEGVDLAEWGKAIQAIPTCKSRPRSDNFSGRLINQPWCLTPM